MRCRKSTIICCSIAASTKRRTPSRIWAWGSCLSDCRDTMQLLEYCVQDEMIWPSMCRDPSQNRNERWERKSRSFWTLWGWVARAVPALHTRPRIWCNSILIRAWHTLCSIWTACSALKFMEHGAQYLTIALVQSFYYDNEPALSNEEFDNLKEELLWAGSKVAILR